jgi:hypothetical protein
MGDRHVGRAGAKVGIRCRESDGFALQREQRKAREVDPYEDGQGNPAAGSYRRAGRGEHGRRAYVANEMRTLAQAFRTQAEIITKKRKRRKNQLLDKSDVQTRRTRPSQEDRRSRPQEGPGAISNRLP